MEGLEESDDEDEDTMAGGIAGVYGKYLRCWEDNVDECSGQPPQLGSAGPA